MPAPARLTIDLGAVVSNWQFLKSQATHGQCAGVVKADGYGLGADKVGPALYAAGCRQFFVAHLPEGIALRTALPQAEIFVLNGLLPGEVGPYRASRLIPVLNDPGQVALWMKEAQGAAAAIHVDTGMNRLGLRVDEARTLFTEPSVQAYPWRLLMSHFACADEPGHPLNQIQRDAFFDIAKLLPDVPTSLANSSGIFLGTDYHGDLLRPGVALYGVNPVPGKPNPLKSTVTLETSILQVRRVDPGMSVGYGAAHKADRPTRVATVAYGYADGYIRSGSGKGAAYLSGHALPILGRVSMDLLTLDATDLPEALVHPGAMVELFGPSRSVDDVANDAGTIGYEILTDLGRRADRVYIGAR
ncbi:alanine racemase [Lacibacterium aquatile]|uniref:Alanine racemase n=1 Tax=Lacibacterium aquatile TaxID=1168082 RepID=A0ABW5DPT5_9PROT